MKKLFMIGLGALAMAAAGSALAGDCKDPWVTKAIHEVKGRAPQGSGSTGECDIHRYGGGRWSSYADLVGKVRVAFGMNIAPSAKGGVAANGSLLQNNPQLRGGNVISPGGGNVIAPGGGNVIAPGGGNVIAPGGGNLMQR